VIYAPNAVIEAVPVSVAVSNGMAKSKKYDMCSANG